MKLISLLSGGIDSPVASYLIMKKAHDVIFLHFFNETQNKQGVETKILELVKILSKYQAKTKLIMIPFKEIQHEIIKSVPAEYRMIIYRRKMLEIGEIIRKNENADCFLTGDNLGQVASQTLDNMKIIHEKNIVLTPLLGFDKEETIKIAKNIGTYEISIKPYSDCCSYFISKHPATKAKLIDIENIEKNLKIKKQIISSIKKAKIIQLP